MRPKIQLMMAVFTALTILSMLVACGPQATTQPEPSEAEVAQPAEEPTSAPEPTEPPPAETEPVVLRVGGAAPIDCFNPFSCQFYYWPNGLVNSSLMYAGPDDPSCAPVPYQAETWEVSEDGLTWTFKLYEGSTFSDGTPMNASTLKDLFEWWMASPSALNTWVPFTLYMESVEAVDDTTLVVKHSVPIGTFAGYDSHWTYLLQPDIWSEVDPDQVWSWDNYPPIGSGPYTVTEFEPREYLILDAREDFHLGKPPVDRIVLQMYSNWDAVIQALSSGEIDVTTMEMPSQYFDALSELPDTTVVETPGSGNFALAFNMSTADTAIRHPAIEDVQVRYAIDHAIDKEKFVEVALLGHGTTCAMSQICDPPFSGEVSPNIEVTPYDLDKANELLDEAGYPDSDGDGVRETADGQPLELRVFYDVAQPQLVTAAELMQASLGEVGIELKLEAMEIGTLYDKMKGERDFDIGMWYAAFDIDPYNMDFTYTCWSADAGIGGGNRAGYCNPEFDELLQQYAATMDREEALTYLYEAQELAWADRSSITLGASNGIQAFSNEKFGFQTEYCPSGLGVWGFPQVMDITVK